MALNIADYNRLRVFGAVHRSGSVQGAARELGVTPSAVSQSLKVLEAELDLRLFQRIANRLKSTEEGDHLASVVARFERDLEAGVAKAHTLRHEPHGNLRIGSPFEFGARVLIPALEELGAFPQISFRLELGAPELLMRALVGSRLDLAFCDDGPFLKKYAALVAFTPVFTEELVLVCSKRFDRERIRGERSFGHLVKLPHVDYVADLSVIGLWYEHHFGRVPGTLSLKLVTENAQGVIAAARAGLGLAMVPRYLVTKELETGRLVKVSVRRKELAHAVVLAQLKDRVPGLGEKMLAAAVALRAATHDASRL